jgi:hypothetical protein
MKKPGQLRLVLLPPPDTVALPADVLEQLLDAVAELLLQVERAEEAARLRDPSQEEVADEQRS